MILNLIVLRSGKPEVLVRFYEALGLHFARERHGHGPDHFSCRTGQVVLEIYPDKNGPSTLGTRLGFLVYDLAAACEVAEREGRVVDQMSKTEQGKHAVIQDPAGHVIELFQHG